jgi:HK97 family phage prohead protease
MPEQKQTFAPQTRSFDLDRASINEDSRTVDLVFSTETAEVERWFGVEILDHSPKSVRLGRLQNKAPLLCDHDSRGQIGVVESASLQGRQGIATVRFSKSKTGEEAFQDVRDGIKTKVSVGYRVHGIVMENQKDGLETYRVTDWEPFEISIVSIPADDGAGIRADESIFGTRAASLSTTIAMSKPAEKQERADEQAPVVTPVAPVADKAPVVESRSLPVEPKASQADLDKRAQEIASLEVDRREEIRAIGSSLELDQAIIKEAINGKTSVDDFKRAMFDQLAEKNKAFSVPRQSENVSELQSGSRAATLTAWSKSAKAALGERGNKLEVPDYSKTLTVEGRDYVGGTGNTFHRSLSGALTLIDVAKIDAGIGAPIIDQTTNHAPEIAQFPVDVISGASVNVSVLTGVPTITFRNANEGSSSKKGTFTDYLVQTQVIEEPIQVDIQGVLNASRDPGRVLEAEAMAVTKAVFSHVCHQSWYGGTTQATADAKAPAGLIAQSNSASTHVVDATGSTALSSAFFLELGTGSCDHVYGNDTTLNMGAGWMEESVVDAGGLKLRALVNYLSGRVAPRLANKNCLVRIKNLGTDSGKGLTDILMAQALRKARQLGSNPNAIFMTYRSGEQLQLSRTATTTTGTPVPWPDNYMGIPIYYSNNISEAETV